MTAMLFSLEENHPLAESLPRTLATEPGQLTRRRFPDDESFLRIDSDVTGRHCMILADLARPDDKFLPLVFVARTLKELGAASVGLVAPYLCYMRQDCRFTEGEALTSRIFAGLVSREVDWLVTVDPHLHRYHSLDEIYTIPATAVAGTPVLADWLAQQDEQLLLVGPDAESVQWVESIASRIGQPYVVGSKQRRGDRDVVVTLPDLDQYRGRTAVIIDDVIASGHTLLETLEALQKSGFERIDCAAVHGIFADGADEKLRQVGLRRLITSNSIPHWSNTVDLADALANPVKHHLATRQEQP